IKDNESGLEEIVYTGELKKENSMKKFTFDVPTKILFGPGALNDLGGQNIPGTKALIVITKGASVKRMGYLDRVKAELERAGLASLVFDEVSPNPTLENVMAGAKIARENSCDIVVGLGGGSAIDAAKAIAFSAVNSGNYWDYMVMGKGGKKKQENTPLPIIAIATTSGTGTEANQVSVITNEENLEKLGYFNESLYPTISVVDSELMASVPPIFTAYQGFDALFHAVESYLNVNSHPMVELYALKAVEYVAQYLPRAVANGDDKEARYYMSLASTYAGVFMMTLSAHGIEHSLSAFYPNLPHGAGLMLISRDYHDMHIKKGGAPEKYIKLARAMGAEGNVKPEDFSKKLQSLMEECDMADISMKSFSIKREDLLPMTENAMDIFQAKFLIDPTRLSKDEVLEILTKSFNRG
ncbi:MAG: iron-containing alcohol dehydrogenase, partial [Clostridiaceae bacterium]